MVTEHLLKTVISCVACTMRRNRFLLFLNHLRLPYSILKSFALLLAFHILRHSFANIARQKNANVYDISNALGHSDIKVTEAYLSQFDYQSQDKTMAMVFDSSKEDSNKEELIRLIQNMKADEIESLIKQAKR